MITYPNVKVNLGLSVLRKRPDGYHDLETLFVPCFDIHDTLEIISGDDFSRTSASLFERYPGVPEVPVPENCATLGHSNWLPPDWRSRPSVSPGLRGTSDDAFASLKRGGGPKDIFRGWTPPDGYLPKSEVEVRLKSSPEMISSVSWMSKHGTNSVSRS